VASAGLRGRRWTALYRHASGAQKSAGTYDTEEEALVRAKVAELDVTPLETIELYPATTRGKITVSAYAPRWVEGQELLEANSVEIARSALKRIRPHLGGMAREDVTPDDVRRMLAALKKSGLSDGTVSRTLDVARQLLPKAATEGVRDRIKERRRMRIVTREQARVIERAVLPGTGCSYARLLRRGPGWGELIAIRGTDIEKRGVGYVVKITERGYGKTEAAVRDISVPADIARELAAYGKELCFPGPRGDYLKRSTFRRVFWLPGIQRARITDFRVHDMRHSAISWWVAAGIPLADVCDRAGHSSIAVTNTYVHAVPGDDPFLAVLGVAANAGTRPPGCSPGSRCSRSRSWPASCRSRTSRLWRWRTGTRSAPRAGLVLGIVATLAANVAVGAHFGIVGAVVNAWPAVAFIVASEILLRIIRAAGTIPSASGTAGEPEPDLPGEVARVGPPVPPTVPLVVSAAVPVPVDGVPPCPGSVPGQ
jgi:integrase